MVVVERLEVGGLSLEESIGLYEEGARLNSACKSLLDAASARLEMISQE
ncbi:MAG: exodeoxyribonuclease VII small subunit [Chloroflexi bacterium]|nr:exodeoxyribonuclease VII small subunit [Chloroflexota bacterium]